MGCDWVMQPLIGIRYIDNNGIERCYEFIDFDGCIGIYLTDCDYDATRQMNDWTNKCPNTIIYENGIWNKRANDIVYESPKWCGVSIQYTKNSYTRINMRSGIQNRRYRKCRSNRNKSTSGKEIIYKTILQHHYLCCKNYIYIM